MIFAADFIANIHWQNCFAPKKSKFCAEPRRGGAGMLTHGKAAQRRSPCKICLLRRMFSYVEPARGLTFWSVHGVGVELEEKLDAGFEERVVLERGVGGEELFGGGLCLVQE